MKWKKVEAIIVEFIDTYKIFAKKNKNNSKESMNRGKRNNCLWGKHS